MARRRIESCLWISPALDSPQSGTRRFAHLMRDRCTVVVKALEVWRLGDGDAHDLSREVAAVERTAAHHRLARYHLFGFSAGATVALAAALALGEAVLTVTVLEPASIGDDDWDPVETRWRSQLAQVRALAAHRRPAAFRQLMMGEGERPPPTLPDPAVWTARMDALENMLAATGLQSADLAGIAQPTLVLSGGRSHVRFAKLAERMVQVMPHAESITFAQCSHLAPPHREDPLRLRDILIRHWDRP